MKINFKINYIDQTAAYFTTFPQTENSQKILAKIKSDLTDRAEKVGQDLGGKNLSKSWGQLRGTTLDIKV